MGRVDDADRAREALDEVAFRREQVSTMASRRLLPWWYVTVLSVLVIGQAVVLDLTMRDPSLGGWQLRYGIFMAVVLIGMSYAVSRSAGLQARGWAARDAKIRLFSAMGVYLVVWIAAGTVMRGLDLPWDQTTGAVCGVVAVCVLELVRSRTRRSQGRDAP